MRVVCISDLHSLTTTIPDGDMLICAGDITGCHDMFTALNQIKSFAEWLKKHPHQYKITIAGNHDAVLDYNPRIAARQILKDHNIIYLENEEIIIEELKIFGSPYTPRFFNWSFMKDRGEQISKVWELISDDCDIIVTHGPPHGILDKTEGGDLAGCEELLKRIQSVKPKLCCFGHIHEGYGTVTVNGTIFVNASICDRKYRPINKPIVIDI